MLRKEDRSFDKCSLFRRRSIGLLAGFCSLPFALLFDGCSSDVVNTKSISQVSGQEDHSGAILAETPQEESPELSGIPQIAFDRTRQDVGEIKPGSASSATFRFRNAGGSTLKITDVRQCCGTVVKIDKRELAPGESAALTVECQAGQAAGRLSKKIGIVTNDPKNPTIELAITGEIIATLSWTPARFEIAAYEKNVAGPEIKIKSLDGTPFAVRGFSATGECLTADFDPSIKASEFTLKPKVDRAKLEAQTSLVGHVQIDLAHRDYKAIYLDFDIRPVLEITPRQIFVFNAEIDKPISRTLELQDRRTISNGDVSRRIESIRFKNGGRVEVRTVTNVGQGCTMSLLLWPPDEQMRGSLWTDQLLVQMKEGPQATIPVHVFYRIPSVSSENNPAASL